MKINKATALLFCIKVGLAFGLSNALQIEPNKNVQPNENITKVDNIGADLSSGPRLIHEQTQWFSESQSHSHYHQRHRSIPKVKPVHCTREAKCLQLNYSSCLGAKLPYTSTTLDLTDLNNQEEVQEKLYLYQVLRNIPKCWAVIQPFLCSLYMPKCENGKVDLPSKEMCRIILGPCRILNNTALFSTFTKCEDERLFPPMCKNDVQESKFNISGQCLKPLVATDSPRWFYEAHCTKYKRAKAIGRISVAFTDQNMSLTISVCLVALNPTLYLIYLEISRSVVRMTKFLLYSEGIDGCGLQCKDPLYTDNEHNQIHELVVWGAGICFIFNAFTVITFMIDWKNANRYPALVIFYINCCFLVSCIGWLAQFYGPDSRDDIVCRKDGTLRMSEPSAGENLSCVIVFVLVYYFSMAGMVWFVVLTYAGNLSIQALGKIQERIDKKRAYFHLVAWSLPLVLTITTMALGEIDGDSISGICFVGYVNSAARGGLLLGPLGGVLIVGGYFLTRGLITLIKLKIGSREIISPRASRKIRSTIVRMGLFFLMTLVFGITTFVCHIYHFLHEGEWKASLRTYILCRLTKVQNDWVDCKQDTRPSVAMLQLHILALFAAGIAMSSWVWTYSTIEAWIRFIRRKFDCEVEEPIKLQKHKVIAKAFAKRKVLYNAGRLSITFHNTHTDPVGLNFDLNSVASNDLSSTWAAALPKLVNRRGALTGAATGSVSSQRRNSMDSEISFSVRRVSVESRRNSIDSQLSVQIAELKATRKVNSGRRHRNRRRRRDFSSRRSKNGPLFSRRESSTSLDSQLGAHLLNALAMGNPDVKALAPNLKRRTANAGLDSQHINNLLSNGKLVVPFTIPGQSEISEDENVSLTISESRFNLIVSGQTNEMVVKSLRKGLNITEISTETETEAKKSDLRRSYSRSGRDSRTSRKSFRKERRKSKIEKRKSIRYETDEESYKHIKKLSDDNSSLTSFCPELSNIAVQSSLNSGLSVGNNEKSRSSKQSKTSIDVGVQANAREIATQTQSPFDNELNALNRSIDEIRHSGSKSTCCVSQGTQMSPKSVRSSRDSATSMRESPVLKSIDKAELFCEDIERNLEKNKKNKKKYIKSGQGHEMELLKKSGKSKKSTDISYENEKLLNDKYNIKILKKKT